MAIGGAVDDGPFQDIVALDFPAGWILARSILNPTSHSVSVVLHGNTTPAEFGADGGQQIDRVQVTSSITGDSYNVHRNGNTVSAVASSLDETTTAEEVAAACAASSLPDFLAVFWQTSGDFLRAISRTPGMALDFTVDVTGTGTWGSISTEPGFENEAAGSFATCYKNGSVVQQDMALNTIIESSATSINRCEPSEAVATPDGWHFLTFTGGTINGGHPGGTTGPEIDRIVVTGILDISGFSLCKTQSNLFDYRPGAG